jgi:hypothetical protein
MLAYFVGIKVSFSVGIRDTIFPIPCGHPSGFRASRGVAPCLPGAGSQPRLAGGDTRATKEGLPVLWTRVGSRGGKADTLP